MQPLVELNPFQIPPSLLKAGAGSWGCKPFIMASPVVGASKITLTVSSGYFPLTVRQHMPTPWMVETTSWTNKSWLPTSILPSSTSKSFRINLLNTTVRVVCRFLPYIPTPTTRNTPSRVYLHWEIYPLVCGGMNDELIIKYFKCMYYTEERNIDRAREIWLDLNAAGWNEENVSDSIGHISIPTP